MIASGGALSSSGRKIASGAAAGNGAANKNVTRPAALSDEATVRGSNSALWRDAELEQGTILLHPLRG
jgi:hypothetical protein